MKEKKHWNRRVLSFFLALAMVITQLGVWNAGKESVQAAENSSFTLYYYNESKEPLYVNIWSWAGISFAEDVEVTSEFGWNHDLAVMKAVDGNENWYSVTIKILDAEADDGFTIYQNGTGDDNILVQYDSQYNNQSDYANFVSGTESAYAVKDETVYTNLSEAGLNMEDQADDDDNSTEYNLQITADNTTVEAGDTVSLTAVLKKGQTEITDLEAAGLHLYWWNNTTNSSGEFINYDESNGYSLTLQTTLGTLGTNEIQAKLQDAEWKDIVIKKIEITVNEASNSVKDAPIDVTKVNNLSSDFIMGMDISSMISELQSGVVYRDYDGNELTTLDDICRFIKEQGINHIRVRVWNDPYDANGNGYGGGNNDVAKAKEFADACRNAGLKMLVDFHCSDLWTDPGKQQEPKAWKGYTLEQKKEALNTYITKSLNTIDPSKDVVDMVQVGNEITKGLLWPDGYIEQTENMAHLLQAGIKGVREECPDARIVLHLDFGTDNKMYRQWFDQVSSYALDFDIIGMSYYPHWNGSLSLLLDNMNDISSRYDKDVLVAETSIGYTTETFGCNGIVYSKEHEKITGYPATQQGQEAFLRDLFATVRSVNNKRGIGVFYWEPAWLPIPDCTWASKSGSKYMKDKMTAGNAMANMALFDENGNANSALINMKTM